MLIKNIHIENIHSFGMHSFAYTRWVINEFEKVALAHKHKRKAKNEQENWWR